MTDEEKKAWEEWVDAMQWYVDKRREGYEEIEMTHQDRIVSIAADMEMKELRAEVERLVNADAVWRKKKEFLENELAKEMVRVRQLEEENKRLKILAPSEPLYDD